MEQSRIWEYFQGEGAESFRHARPRLAHLAGLIAPGSDVLDIGVGDGTFARLAARHGLTIHILDPDAAAIERAKTELSLGDRARAGFGQSIPWPDESFDAVVLSEVLEHLDDQTLSGTLGEVARVLRPGGRLIGTVPADERLEEHLVVCPHCARRFHRWGHAQSFSPERMSLLLSTRFAPVEVSRRWFIAWDLLNWKGRLQGMTRRALALCGRWGSGHNLVFVATKPQSQGSV